MKPHSPSWKRRDWREHPTTAAVSGPHTIAATYYPGVYYMSDEIDFYVDISDWKEQRVQAEVLFSSQGHTETFARKRIEIHTGHAGWYAGTGYAEGFVRANPESYRRSMCRKPRYDGHRSHAKIT